MKELFSIGLDKLQSNNDTSLLSKKQVMNELNVSYQTLHRYMTQKGLKYYKMGNKHNSKVLFKRNDVNEWLEGFQK